MTCASLAAAHAVNPLQLEQHHSTTPNRDLVWVRTVLAWIFPSSSSAAWRAICTGPACSCGGSTSKRRSRGLIMAPQKASTPATFCPMPSSASRSRFNVASFASASPSAITSQHCHHRCSGHARYFGSGRCTEHSDACCIWERRPPSVV